MMWCMGIPVGDSNWVVLASSDCPRKSDTIAGSCDPKKSSRLIGFNPKNLLVFWKQKNLQNSRRDCSKRLEKRDHIVHLIVVVDGDNDSHYQEIQL